MSRLRRMLPSPHSLFVFEAAARHSNFKAAAAELNVTQPSISHAIKALEQHCGARLFVRENRGVSLTPAGRALHESVRTGFNRIEESLAAIGSGETQYLTLAASTSLAAHWLVPQLPHFQQQHTGTRIKIVSADRDTEPDQEIDMTIWVRPRDFARPGSRYICDEVVFPVCSSAYLASAPPLENVGDLARHRLIHAFDAHRRRLDWPSWLALAGGDAAAASPDIILNDYQLAVQAALAGEGVALGWSLTVQVLLRHGLLVAPLEARIHTGNAFFLIGRDRGPRSEERELLAAWIASETAGLRP